MSEPLRCGYVAIVGRPNVGKSTLLNRLIGRKLSATSHRPCTTRYRVLGISTRGASQAIYVDTPGLGSAQGRRDRSLSAAVDSGLDGAALALFVCEQGRWGDGDERALQRLLERGGGLQPLLVLNKVDRLSDPAALLPQLAYLATRADFVDLVPVSALKNHNVERLWECVQRRLPLAAHRFPPGCHTNCAPQFLVEEMLREQLMRQLGDELPYTVRPRVEQLEWQGGLCRIHAVLEVRRERQRAIVIGRGARALRAIGTAARRDLEPLLGRRVFLRLWVRVARPVAVDRAG